MRTAAISEIVSVGISACIITGCATVHSPWMDIVGKTNIGTEVSGCGDILRNVHRAVANAETGDAEVRRIRGFTYLRIDRFLAHLGQRFKNRASGPAFEAWVDRMRAADADATRVEIANLPRADLDQLSQRVFGRVDTRNRIFDVANKCADQQRAIQLADPRHRRRLIDVAHVPDNYSEFARFVGLFPLTSIPVALGWERWKQENLSTFRQPAANLPVQGRIVEFAPAESKGVLKVEEVRAIVERSRDRLLNIPEPKGRDLEQLFDSFAPIWQIDVTGGYDRVGYPTWHDDGAAIVVDQAKPTVFTRVSHAIVGKQVLLQLNFSVWFQERPRDGPLDTLGGNLDGLIWRVTLAPDGRPLIYDSVHTCGCYHLLFPLGPMLSKPHHTRTHALKELPAILNTAPMPGPRQRVLLRLATATHYLVAASVVEPEVVQHTRRVYRFAEDRSLRSLRLPSGGRRSLFRDDGIIAGTERLERFVLWPTGVNSPGALRQWGHHATAFLDRRHFDDPNLFERIFGK